jgi:hypothetical protein
MQILGSRCIPWRDGRVSGLLAIRFDNLKQGIDIDRLSDDRVCMQIISRGRCECADHYHRYPGQPRISQLHCTKLPPVHSRHVDIENDQTGRSGIL